MKPDKLASFAGVPFFACVILLGMRASEAQFTQRTPPDRAGLAEALRQSESLRSIYSVESSITYHYEVSGVIDARKVRRRLSDGTGRFRQEMLFSLNHGKDTDIVHVACWDGTQSSGHQHRLENSTHVVSFSFDRDNVDHLDEIDTVLGLRNHYPWSDAFPPIPPSAAIANPETPIHIDLVNDSGADLVRVRIEGPWGGVGNTYIYDFDPQRQWLMVGTEIRVYQTKEQRETDDSRYIMGYEVAKAEQIEGVWMPREIRMLTRMAEPSGETLKWTEYPATMRLEAIDLNPEISDDLFTISLDGLPDGTDVADARLGISYKLGRNLIYADGVLHEVAEPIRHEISAHEMESLLAASTPLIEPALAQVDLKPLRSDALRWAGRAAIALTAGLVLAAGVIVFRRRARSGG